MLAVIERSGVSSASLYRRWRTKQALVVAALESLTVDVFDCDTGTLRGDLAAFAVRTAKVLAEHGPLLARLTSELNGNADVFNALRERLLAPRLDELAAVLQRAQARGELPHRPPPAEDVLSMLTGSLHHRALVLGRPLGKAFVRAAIDQTAAYLSTA